MKKGLACGLIFLILLCASAAFAQEKPRIAVLRFSNNTSAHWWSGSTATELQDLLINELAATRAFRIMERRELGGALGEQQLSESGLTDPSTRLKTGRIKGAQYLVSATVSAYEESGDEGGGVNFRGFSFGGGKKTAYIAVDLKVIDAETAEIIDTRTIEAASTSGGMRVSGSSAIVPGLSGSLGRQTKTPTGKAIRGCIIEITDYLECSLALKDEECLKQYSAKDTRRRNRSKSSIELDE
ncbi:MAG: CsgG/HfaB family protein [Smithellaceae bacterium]|nr:CsgG/HfaB family protein [Smithellaceae bacterium]